MGTKTISGLLRSIGDSIGVSRSSILDLESSLGPVQTGVQEVTRESVQFVQNAAGGSDKLVQSFTTLEPITRNLRDDLIQSNLQFKDWSTFAEDAKKEA